MQGRDKYGLRHPDWLNFLRDSKSSAAYERRILDFVQWRENAGLLPFETSVSHEELLLKRIIRRKFNFEYPEIMLFCCWLCFVTELIYKYCISIVYCVFWCFACVTRGVYGGDKNVFLLPAGWKFSFRSRREWKDFDPGGVKTESFIAKLDIKTRVLIPEW